MRRAACAALVLAACTREEAKLGAPSAVKLALVHRAGAPAGTHYSAHIAPALEVKLAFKVAGYVDSVAKIVGVDGKLRAIQQGDSVREGMQLAGLRKTEFLHRVAEARAARAQAGAAAQQARTDFNRSSSLAKQNAVAGAEVDQARTQLVAMAALYGGAQARFDEARTALTDATLVSPIEGVVLEDHVAVGELVAPGAPAFVVADVSSVKAEFGVPDTMLSRLEFGATLTVTSDAYPGEQFAGRITLIAPSADPHSRVFEIDITIPNPDGRLKTGSVVALALGATPALDSPLVPISAIVRSPAHPEAFAVYVVEESGAKMIARAREVELDDYLGRDVPVKRGLVDGERIIVQGAKLVADGEEVAIIP